MWTADVFIERSKIGLHRIPCKRNPLSARSRILLERFKRPEHNRTILTPRRRGLYVLTADRERREVFGAHHVPSFHFVAKLFRSNSRASREQQKMGRRSNRDERFIRPFRKRRQRVVGRLQNRKPAPKTEAECFWAQRDSRS